jgi:hypothetical protein
MSERIDRTQDVTSRIALRVPGPWRQPGDLRDALKRDGGDAYEMQDDAFVEKSTGRRFECGVSPPDDQIAGIFEHTRRLSTQEVKALRRHTVKVHLAGPGGSVEAARAIMAAATALVKAGGLGVMIDSSTAAHGPRDWMKLANDTQAGGLYWAFVMVTGGMEEAFSCGMHCLGLRDAEVMDPPDVQAGAFVLHNFLGYTYQSGVVVSDGDPLGDEDHALFRARHHACTRFPPGSPVFNPYGVWRLEPVEGDDSGLAPE